MPKKKKKVEKWVKTQSPTLPPLSLQMTPKGFEYISAGCPSLQEAVMNDMPTLSDTCVLVRVYFCNISEATQSKPDVSEIIN